MWFELSLNNIDVDHSRPSKIPFKTLKTLLKKTLTTSRIFQLVHLLPRAIHLQRYKVPKPGISRESINPDVTFLTSYPFPRNGAKPPPCIPHPTRYLHFPTNGKCDMEYFGRVRVLRTLISVRWRAEDFYLLSPRGTYKATAAVPVVYDSYSYAL